MIVAIMQPYFFPYIGYFQLMNAVDCFVFYDDAQFMKGGWVNRNRLLRDGQPAWWTLPIVRDDFRLPINRRHYRQSSADMRSTLGKVEGAYRHAPQFDAIFPRLADFFSSGETVVSRFNRDHLTSIARDLGIRCDIRLSSELGSDAGLAGQARVIDICRRLDATGYINASGGRGLYEGGAFADAGISLQFLEAEPTDYRQFAAPHLPFLSIVDVLMFNPTEVIAGLLARCRRVGPLSAETA